jgi:hypothetical protein
MRYVRRDESLDSPLSAVLFLSPAVCLCCGVIQVARTPYLGPAIRVPVVQHTTPTKSTHFVTAAVGPSTITPRKKTPTMSGAYTANGAHTPIPKLDWHHHTNSPQPPKTQRTVQPEDDADDDAEQSRSLSSLPRADTPPHALSYRSDDLTDDDASFECAHQSSLYFHPNLDSPSARPHTAVTPYTDAAAAAGRPTPIVHAHVSTAAEWSARIADAANHSPPDTPSMNTMTTPHEQMSSGPLSKPHAWPLNSQQLDWLLSEAEQYDLAAQS